MKYLKLIRLPNLLMLALMQLIVRFGYLEQIEIPLAMFYWQYALLIISTVLIAAGGYVINDIFDQEIDLENKPNSVIIGKSVSENAAYTFYATLTITGVALGFILANSVSHPNFAIVFVLTATLLYFYASFLKKITLVGNLVVALLLAFSVVIIGLFDIVPNTFEVNKPQMTIAFAILLDYAKFAFIINLIREIVKDMEDINGDANANSKSIPIVLGINTTSKITFILMLLPSAYLLYYCNTYLMQNNLYYATIYILLLVVAPLLYCAIKILYASTSLHFRHISTTLKWVILFGIISIAITNYNINHV